MSQKLPVDGFEWVEDILIINEELNKFIKIITNYDEESDIRYIFEEDIKYPKILHDLHSDLSFLPEKMKINKCSKLVCDLYEKKYIVHLKALALNQVLNHGLILIKVHRVTQFNQKAWLKPYVNMNTKLRKEAKNDFEKYFLKLMNNLTF